MSALAATCDLLRQERQRRAATTGYVNIDAAPLTTATPPLASSATSGWVNSAQTVTLTAVDVGTGGADQLQHRRWPDAHLQRPLHGERPGSHAVTYFSTDKSGNVEPPQTGYVNIDAGTRSLVDRKRKAAGRRVQV